MGGGRLGGSGGEAGNWVHGVGITKCMIERWDAAALSKEHELHPTHERGSAYRIFVASKGYTSRATNRKAVAQTRHIVFWPQRYLGLHASYELRGL